MISLFRWILGAVLRVAIAPAAAVYGGEGLNIPLRFLPTRWIAATLRRYGATIEERVRFLSPVTVHNTSRNVQLSYENLSVGNDCYLGRELFLDLADRIVIEDQVTISHQVMFVTHTDLGSSPLARTSLPASHAPIVVRRGAYLGARVTVLQGVEIGAESIVGAGALVTKSVPPRTVVAGVPARVLRTLPAETLTDNTSAAEFVNRFAA